MIRPTRQTDGDTPAGPPAGSIGEPADATASRLEDLAQRVADLAGRVDAIAGRLDELAARVEVAGELLRELLSRAAAPPQRYLTVAGAAAYTGLSPDSIRALIEQGRLTALRPVRGRILVDRDEVDAVVRSATGRPARGRGMSAGSRRR
ncbi:MAG: excisionase family DNA-binding protein [Pirellulales bacterium]|nr:excisionase family DNA-binding protein [Pirellulales bacterium]